MLVLVSYNEDQPVLKNLDWTANAFAVPNVPYSLYALCSDGQALAILVKTAGEVLHGIRQNTLQAETYLLRASSRWCYLLIVGNLTPDGDSITRHDNKPTGWTWASVQGALLSIQEQGVAVIIVQNDQQIVDCVSMLAKRDRTAQRIAPPRESLWNTPAETILTALPGIGPATADKLLSRYGSAAAALAVLGDLDRDPGCGVSEKTQRAVYAALGIPDDAALALTTRWTADEQALITADRDLVPA